MEHQGDIASLLETGALKIAPPGKAFWYTSGLIGPYFLNTHYLCGGEERALELLDFVEENQDERESFPSKMLRELESIYSSHTIYRTTIEALASFIKEHVSLEQVNFISGGQRRDWFFSPLVARALNKPCLYIYNDETIIDAQGQTMRSLDEKSVLNIADLLTVASSYTKKWVPAVSKRGGFLKWSVNVVDRNQGGTEQLREAGVKGVFNLYTINRNFFTIAEKAGYINQDQFNLICEYLNNPKDSMHNFLKANPQFLKASLESSDEKTKERANLCVAENLYDLN